MYYLQNTIVITYIRQLQMNMCILHKHVWICIQKLIYVHIHSYKYTIDTYAFTQIIHKKKLGRNLDLRTESLHASDHKFIHFKALPSLHCTTVLVTTLSCPHSYNFKLLSVKSASSLHLETVTWLLRIEGQLRKLAGQ